MGHVDHGKTTLLDTLRNLVLRQVKQVVTSISVLTQIVENGKKITFLDTPGHAALLYARGASARYYHLAVA